MAETKRADVLSYLESANMVEISELISEIEEKFGVTAAAPVAVAVADDKAQLEAEVSRLRNELQDVVGEYRDRERKLREAYYALDRLRHEQVTQLDSLLDETRADASAEATRYEALLISQRSEADASGAQYQAQIDEMAEGYARLESEVQQLNRLWSVRFRSWIMRKLRRQ